MPASLPILWRALSRNNSRSAPLVILIKDTEKSNYLAFEAYQTGLLLTLLKLRPNQFRNNCNKYDDGITSYSGVIDHLLRHYGTYAVVANAEKDIRSFRRGS